MRGRSRLQGSGPRKRGLRDRGFTELKCGLLAGILAWRSQASVVMAREAFGRTLSDSRTVLMKTP